MPDQPHSTPTSELPRSLRVQRLNGADPDLTQPINVPVPDGNGAPALSPTADAQTDPTPAATPVASRAATPDERDRAGAGRPTAKPIVVRDPHGRFTAKPTIPAMSADLAQALLDADAEVWRVDNALRTAGVLVFAVEFEDRVRNGGGAA